MKVRRLTLLLIPALLLAGCEYIAGPGQPRPSWTSVPLDERVVDAYTGFGFELFRHLRAEDPHANVFTSPTSAALALAMTYNGAAGKTATEMARALGVEHLGLDTLNRTNRTWIEALQQTGDPMAELAIANSIWYRQTYTLLDSFRDRVRSSYDAEILPISNAAAINSWVDSTTRGRIREVVAGEIPGDVVAYLINALYFKADWTHPFPERATRSASFHLPNGGTATVPMMSQERAFEMRRDELATMVRLPYGTGRFSMVLALPEAGADLGSLAERLEPARWRTWMSDFQEVPRLRVELPRFEVEWESSLVESLRAMGMQVPFEAGLADFSEMFAGGGPWIGDVLQKTFLRVDEKGTEAAAVTVVVMLESAPPTITFDRPFFLAIYDHATETVLFLGQIVDPR